MAVSLDWQIDGWQYGFLQGVNDSRSTVAGMDEAVDVTIYTCEPGGRRRYVAKILDLECLSRSQSDAAHKHFSANGWIDEMRSEIIAVGGYHRSGGSGMGRRHYQRPLSAGECALVST